MRCAIVSPNPKGLEFCGIHECSRHAEDFSHRGPLDGREVDGLDATWDGTQLRLT